MPRNRRIIICPAIQNRDAKFCVLREKIVKNLQKILFIRYNLRYNRNIKMNTKIKNGGKAVWQTKKEDFLSANIAET